MCKIGDILLIYDAKDKYSIGQHPFIVLDDTAGTVKGVYSYDFVGLLMSSANSEKKKQKLKKYEGNLSIMADDKIINDVSYDNRDAYVKADQFFYFDKDKITYIKIGSVIPDIFNLIIEFINELSSSGVEFRQIIDNAEPNV